MNKPNYDDSFPHIIVDNNDKPKFSIAFCKQQVEDLIDYGLEIFDIDYKPEFRMNNELLFNVFVVCHSQECKNMLTDETWNGFYSKSL